MRIIWGNVWTTPQRILAWYLRKKGWVAFYLEERYRKCSDHMCFLNLYQQGIERDRRNKEPKPDEE